MRAGDDEMMVWPRAHIRGHALGLVIGRCSQPAESEMLQFGHWSIPDECLQWSMIPSCPKWSASGALINFFSFGWFCLISDGGSLHWEHSAIRIKLDLLKLYKIGPPASIYHIFRVSKHQFIKSSCYKWIKGQWQKGNWRSRLRRKEQHKKIL